jgi:methionine synthase II (cobalamin-independent)
MSFLANCLATTIGSLPLDDAEEATNLILTYTPQIPAWVQLAKRPKEGMIIQFTEGLPGLKWSNRKVYFNTKDTGFQDEVLKFYEHYLAATEEQSNSHLEKFSLTPYYAEGFHTLIEILKHNKYNLIAIKGQVTGPFTLATSLSDQDGKSAFYNPQLRDIIVKMICLKTKWQIRKLHSFGVPVIISVDEPSLVGFGSSAYLGISGSDIQKDLNEIITLIHSENGYAGIHCCENTDWSMLLATDIDILSFDAYSFFDKLMLYAESLKDFIARDGILAWGLIPTSYPEKLEKETVHSLIQKWQSYVEQLTYTEADTKKVVKQSLITPSCGAGSLSQEDALRLITPSCGAGSLSQEDALRALQLLKEVSQGLRKLYFN